jgi:hypothetical protein
MSTHRTFSILLCVFAMSFLAISAEAAVQVSVGVNSSDFGFLGNYGTWVNVTGYGQVWRPHPVSGWSPFSRGEWVRADQGWTWNSDEPYGWAVYHYGNWVLTPSHGWVWVPGYEWSPARVQWMNYGDYAAWAPLPMAGVRLPDPWVNRRYWSVVPMRHLTQRNVRMYFVSGPVAPARTVHIVRTAPEFTDVERIQNRKIDVVHLNTTEVQGGKYKFKRVEVVHTNAHNGKEVHKVTVKEQEKGKHNHKKKKTEVTHKEKKNGL